ncbi:MAG: cupin domain-containing protein [Actinomycetota bacterium]|nr:cupin domain-containing protein [Actinomycetota bacterium]
MGYQVDILAETRANDDFRRVLETTDHAQVVVMSVAAGEDIGEETHAGIDQVLVFVEGAGEADLDGDVGKVGPGSLVVVPSGTRHNVRNTGDGSLRLYTVYGPPEHAPGTVHRTKAEAEADEHHH